MNYFLNYLSLGEENDTDAVNHTLTGRSETLPLKYRITNSKSGGKIYIIQIIFFLNKNSFILAFIQFFSNHSSPHNFTGFLMTYESFGELDTKIHG